MLKILTFDSSSVVENAYPHLSKQSRKCVNSLPTCNDLACSSVDLDAKADAATPTKPDAADAIFPSAARCASTWLLKCLSTEFADKCNRSGTTLNGSETPPTHTPLSELQQPGRQHPASYKSLAATTDRRLADHKAAARIGKHCKAHRGCARHRKVSRRPDTRRHGEAVGRCCRFSTTTPETSLRTRPERCRCRLRLPGSGESDQMRSQDGGFG
ncbi:hypothetical protein HNP40_004097 [Mycobacteroides chelonae]|nr:hypothetical protein [Mycobacteroides chelonae]